VEHQREKIDFASTQQQVTRFPLDSTQQQTVNALDSRVFNKELLMNALDKALQLIKASK
jgi:hypothetical protein